MKKTILFISLIYFFSCNNKNSTENKTAIKPQAEHTEIKYVTAKSGLNYRKKPKKEVIGKFEYGKALSLIMIPYMYLEDIYLLNNHQQP